MTVSTATFDAMGSCLSIAAASLNHDCNPNSIYQFSKGSLAIRSLRTIPPGAEVTISYVNPRTPAIERQTQLRNQWFFTCSCDYSTKALTCGQADIPPSLSCGMSAEELAKLDNEGRRLQEQASTAPTEALEILTRAMALFTPHKAIYPLWRSPWMSIRHDIISAHISQGNWASALGHALKMYLYIDPVLFPDTWNPQRAAETYGLLKIVMEIMHELTKPERNEQLLGELQDYRIDFPSVARHLSEEVESTFKKGFGPRSPIAEDLESYEKQAMGFGRSDWQVEVLKLRKAADALVD